MRLRPAAEIAGRAIARGGFDCVLEFVMSMCAGAGFGIRLDTERLADRLSRPVSNPRVFYLAPLPYGPAP
ncbi:hypothetical protein GCM10009565_49140 [Amycolatopsis albidoflavus]